MSTASMTSAALATIAGVRGVIKLHPCDFASIPGAPFFSHVNLAPCNHVEGEDFALAQIVDRSADGQPLLSPVNVVKVRLLSLQHFRDLSTISSDQLGDMIGGPGTHDDLLELLHLRYGKVRNLGLSQVQASPLVLSRLMRVGG